MVDILSKAVIDRRLRPGAATWGVTLAHVILLSLYMQGHYMQT